MLNAERAQYNVDALFGVEDPAECDSGDDEAQRIR
jgi:hypothetical protein